MSSIGSMRGFGPGLFLVAVASLGMPATAGAQERDFPGWDRIPVRDRLLAARAARVRGMRDLGQAILALRIDGRPLSEHLGIDDEASDRGGLLIRGFRTDDPRFSDDGFARVRVWIRTDLAWAAILDLRRRLPAGVDGESFARAVGGGILEVEGLGRSAGFAAAPLPPPAGRDDENDDEEQGSLPQRDRRHASRFPVPRPRSLEPGPERARLDSGWRTLSTRVVRSWEVPSPTPHLDCGEEGRWETIETRVLERRVVSERVVVR
jgi:hypothetical protein